VYQEACVGDNRYILPRIMLTQISQSLAIETSLCALYSVVICCPVRLKSTELVVLAKVRYIILFIHLAQT
jgi:hypothetical protein